MIENNEDIKVSWKSGQSRLEQYFGTMTRLQSKLGKYLGETEPLPGYYAEWFTHFVILIKETGAGTGLITHYSYLESPIDHPYIIRPMPGGNFDILIPGETTKMQRVDKDATSIRDILMNPTKPVLSELSRSRREKGGTSKAKKRMILRKTREFDKGKSLPIHEVVVKDSDLDSEGNYRDRFLMSLKPGDVFTHPYYNGDPRRGLLKLQVLKYPELDEDGEVHGLLVRAIEVQPPTRPRKEYIGNEKEGTERLINKDYGTDIDQGEVYFYGEGYNRSERLIEIMESLWSGKVKSKWKPSPGLFASCNAAKIADEVSKGHKDLKSAIASINFYRNRAGENLSKKCQLAMEKAIELLHKKYK